MFKMNKNVSFLAVIFTSFSLLISLLLTSFSYAETQAPQKTVEEVQALASNPPADLIILDVRTPKEFDHGALPHAMLIDFYEDDFADNVDKLDKSKTYIVYCRTGIRGGKAQALMLDRGFSKVYNLAGGFNAYFPEKAYELDSLK